MAFVGFNFNYQPAKKPESGLRVLLKMKGLRGVAKMVSPVFTGPFHW